MTVMAGAATRVINCDVGDDLSGQMHRRFCARIRDNLEANVLYLSDGRLALVLASLDLLGCFEPDVVAAMRERVAGAANVSARDVVIASTHTHPGRKRSA